MKTEHAMVPVELLAAVVVALEAAADSGLPDVQIFPPSEWGLDSVNEDLADGWCSIAALSECIEGIIANSFAKLNAEPVADKCPPPAAAVDDVEMDSTDLRAIATKLELLNGADKLRFKSVLEIEGPATDAQIKMYEAARDCSLRYHVALKQIKRILDAGEPNILICRIVDKALAGGV